MDRTMIGLVIALSLAYETANAAPVQILETSHEQVNLGAFNVFEEKKASVVLTNTSRDSFVAAGIKANCSCIRTKLKDMEIGPKGKTTLEITAMFRTEGEFSHDVLVIPKDKERHAPLRIQVRGCAIELVVCALAWPGRPPIQCDLAKWTNLGTVHYKEVTPVIHLSSKNDRFDMDTARIDVNSRQFELYDYRFARAGGLAHGPLSTTDGKHWLILTLKPRKALKAQTLKDVVEIRLGEKVRLYVPWTCRVVGNVYAEDQRISLGSLASCPEKQIVIRFADDHPKWDRVQWVGADRLSQAIQIEEVQDTMSASYICLKVHVDQSKLASLPKGYLFGRVTLYQNGLTDEDAVPILIDGFK